MIGFYILAAMAVAFPVASYLLYLSMINARPQATMISGPWDFVGVLGGLAGFLLIGGPWVLLSFHAHWRPALVQGPWSELASGKWGWLWAVPWAVYFLLVVAGSALLLRLRRRYTVIYNVEPAVLDEALQQVCLRLNLNAERIGNRVNLRVPEVALERTASHSIQVARGDPGLPLPAGADEPVVSGQDIQGKVDLDPFPTMRHVTLRWQRARGTIREDVEGELARYLSNVENLDNPAASWLLTMSSCLFSAIFLGLIGFVILMMKGR
ncbi:MAG: hypothetical protein JNM56_30100 [Planctomycetia bacterium]|nr:hypothetical protein [Planctomycetia bacterium]